MGVLILVLIIAIIVVNVFAWFINEADIQNRYNELRRYISLYDEVDRDEDKDSRI